MRRLRISHVQKICRVSYYDGMEKSGKKRNPREIFNRKPYDIKQAEAQNEKRI